MSRYRYLFSPMHIGPVVLRNRIVFSAHLTNYAEDGLPTEQHAAYYGAACGRWGRTDRHRGALHPSDGLAVREVDPRLPCRGRPRLPAHHRSRPSPRHADLRSDQPQRRPGVGDVQPVARVGAFAGGRPTVPRGSEGDRPARDRRDRRWIRHGCLTLQGGRVRRHRAAVLAQLDRARLPLACHERPYGRVRRLAREPRSAAVGHRGRGARSDRPRPRARRPAVRRRAHRGRHHHRRRGRRRRAWSKRRD